MTIATKGSQYMTPTHTKTMNLRFVEKSVPAPEFGENISKIVRVLQQMYVPINWDTHDEEWRDVPFVSEAD